MTMIEPRVAERRKQVSEDRARRRLKRVLGIIVMVAVGAAFAWLLRSPVLSVETIDVAGAEHSDPLALLRGIGVDVGIPTIDVNAGSVEAVIEADPWVADASVTVEWPGTVVVDVVEHHAVAPARASAGWVLLSRDASVLEETGQPAENALWIDIDVGRVSPGDTIDDALVEGAVAFVSALSPELRDGAVIYTQGQGLYARVGGHVVRLGRPTDLEAKAAVLAALVDEGLEADARVNLIAPLRPAVTYPRPQVEPEE